jgi:hypothetical protein
MVSKRCCDTCAHACAVRRGPAAMRVCANRPDAPGELTQVAGDGCCPRFLARRAPVVRLEPPAAPDEGTRFIPLTQGKFAMVDTADYEWLSRYKWHAIKVAGNFYACRKEGGKTILMHRQIMQPPQRKVVDHKNNNSLDDHRHNLRICTQQQNMCNRRPHGSESGFKGVTRHRDKWSARVKHRGKQYYLGHFDDPVEAARARDRKARELAGEYAWLNCPDAVGGRIICLQGIIRVRVRLTGRLQILPAG